AVGVGAGDLVEREILVCLEPPARDAHAYHELIMLGFTRLLQFGGAVAVISLIDPVKFEDRISLAVERRRRVREVARDMAAQMAALLLDRLGLGDLLDNRNHVAALQGAGRKYRLPT